MLLARTKHLQSPDSEDRLHTIKGRRGAQDWLEPDSTSIGQFYFSIVLQVAQFLCKLKH